MHAIVLVYCTTSCLCVLAGSTESFIVQRVVMGTADALFAGTLRRRRRRRRRRRFLPFLPLMLLHYFFQP